MSCTKRSKEAPGAQSGTIRLGPEVIGRGWNIIGQMTVQVIERGRGAGRHYVVVALLHRRIVMPWGERAYPRLDQARRAALALAVEISGGAVPQYPRRADSSLWGVRVGPIFCAEALS